MIFSTKQKIIWLIVAGALVGGIALFLYGLRFHTFLGNDPKACINCHIMEPYYATWMHSSHGRNTNCNDCHVPHENFARKWFFKGMDGSRHVAMFVTRREPFAMRANPTSANVIMNNCIRCHTQLNQEFVKTGRINYMMTQQGAGKACWDCHRDVPHGGINTPATTPNNLVPRPPSPAPEWLAKTIQRNKQNKQ